MNSVDRSWLHIDIFKELPTKHENNICISVILHYSRTAKNNVFSLSYYN